MPLTVMIVFEQSNKLKFHCFSEEREVEDVVDSDFDIDENDEPQSDQEVDEKTKRQVGTKAYKVCIQIIVHHNQSSYYIRFNTILITLLPRFQFF